MLLRELQEKRCLLNVYFDAGPVVIPPLYTTLSLVDESRNILQLDLNSVLNEGWCGRQLYIETKLDRIDISFTLEPVTVNRSDGDLVLESPLPDCLIRLQRRRAHRVETPKVARLHCYVPQSQAGQGAQLLRIHDLSSMGVSVELPPGLQVSPGQIWQNCHIDLPDFGVVHTALEIVNIRDRFFPVAIFRIAGCRLLDLPAPSKTMLENYLAKLPHSSVCSWCSACRTGNREYQELVFPGCNISYCGLQTSESTVTGR